MNFLKQYFARRAEAELKVSRETRAAREEHFQISIRRLNQQSDEMASKHCPLVGKNCILGSCVHFNPGRVTQYEGGYNGIMIREPRCKLWEAK
jgi:hypothetical protein